jgi:hypothetical protein
MFIGQTRTADALGDEMAHDQLERDAAEVDLRQRALVAGLDGDAVDEDDTPIAKG